MIDIQKERFAHRTTILPNKSLLYIADIQVDDTLHISLLHIFLSVVKIILLDDSSNVIKLNREYIR